MARYDEMKFKWVLPVSLRSDAFDAAMAAIVDKFGADASEKTRGYSVWNAIDDLDSDTIDALAEELNILWYDKTASIEARRGVVKNCKRIQPKLGTKWALEKIMEIYFSGGAYVTEWFDYDEIGDPNHFTVEAEALTGTVQESKRFLEILSKVKRKSAILDKVIGVIRAEGTPDMAIWPQDRITVHTEARR